MDAGENHGGSGSPVFEWSGSGDHVALLGLLWGGNSDGTCYCFFSPVSGIERELGALTTY